MLRGVDLEQVLEGPADRWLNLVLALQVEQIGSGWATPYTVLLELVAAPEPEQAPTLATWGMSADAQAGQAAMMNLR